MVAAMYNDLHHQRFSAIRDPVHHLHHYPALHPPESCKNLLGLNASSYERYK
jgi:hypothetical protein